MRIVKVIWRDALSGNGWHTREEIDDIVKEGLPVINSIGHLYHECSDFIMLIQTIDNSQGDNSFADNYILIPKSWIMEVKECS